MKDEKNALIEIFQLCCENLTQLCQNMTRLFVSTNKLKVYYTHKFTRKGSVAIATSLFSSAL